MVAELNICVVIWSKICASKEQFDIEIHQNLVKIKKKRYLQILHKGHLIRKQLQISYSDSEKF